MVRPVPSSKRPINQVWLQTRPGVATGRFVGPNAARQKPTAVVLNAVEPHLKETEQARAFITNKASLALAPGYFSKAVAYHRAITAGLGVTEFEPTGKAAQPSASTTTLRPRHILPTTLPRLVFHKRW